MTPPNKITGANSRPASQFERHGLRRRALVAVSRGRYHGGAAVAQFVRRGRMFAMRRMFTVVALVVGCSCLTGCILPVPWPGRTETSPDVRGHIADASTKQPVTGVRVQIHDRPDTATVSDITGEFHLAAVREFYLMRFVTPCPVYYFPAVRDRSYTVDISHSDYEAIQLDVVDQWVFRDSPQTNPPLKEMVIHDVLLVPKSK